MIVNRFLIIWLALVGLALTILTAGCDSLEPRTDPILVVEGFLDTGKPLPAIRLRKTLSLLEPYTDDGATAATDAQVWLTLGDTRIEYVPDENMPGRYLPSPTTIQFVPENTLFSFEAMWNDQEARASGLTPFPIDIDAIRVNVPDEPVEAILLDSLQLDSLNTGARKGFIYPIEVTVRWRMRESDPGLDTLSWVRTQLKPVNAFSSTVIDFFLRSEQIVQEYQVLNDSTGRKKWTGVYAVSVDKKTDPLPEHNLKVSLLRAGQDYARYASSRDAPERREPVSNVQGAIGIVAGVSVDSVSVYVK